MLYIVCDIGAAPTKINVSRSIGIDVGLTTLATLSNGQSINNPRWTRKHEAKIAAASRKLALKQKRSKNSARASELLRRAYQRSANTRINYIHHISKLLTQSYDLIAYENLNIESMVRSAKGTVDKPGKNVAQKSGLNKSIMDAAWGILIYQIAYKAESAGKWAIAVNPRGTTQLCSGCGGKVPKSISERRHKCLDCGLDIGRDHNAAINILRLGMSLAGLKDPSEYTNNLCINSRREYRA